MSDAQSVTHAMPPDRGFATSEFEARTARLQAEMAEMALDAVLLTSPADLFYFAGFLTRFWESPARPWFLVIPAKDAPIAVIPAIGAELMTQGWIRQIRTWPAPDPQDDGVSLLAKTLTDCVPVRGQIGVPMGLETHLRMPLADFHKLQRSLQPRAWSDATHAVQRVREIKSEAEIDKIRFSCAIAGRAFERVPEIAARDVPLDQLFRRFQALLLEEGADWVSYLAGGAGPGGYGDVISPAGPSPLLSGDVLMLDTGAVWDGYFCDFDRNFAIGPLDPATRDAQAALTEATDHVLRHIRPDQSARDVHAMFVRELASHGQTPLGGRLGHGLGVTLTEWPSFTARDETCLRAGMVLTLEPGVEIAPGRILVHEENIVLRPDGAELLSPRAPAEMPVL